MMDSPVVTTNHTKNIKEGMKIISHHSTTLDELKTPSSAEDVCVAFSNLRRLILNEGLKILYCYKCLLQNLELPDTIHYLDCNNNPLELIKGSSSLRKTICYNNLLKSYNVGELLRCLYSDNLILYGNSNVGSLELNFKC